MKVHPFVSNDAKTIPQHRPKQKELGSHSMNIWSHDRIQSIKVKRVPHSQYSMSLFEKCPVPTYTFQVRMCQRKETSPNSTTTSKVPANSIATTEEAPVKKTFQDFCEFQDNIRNILGHGLLHKNELRAIECGFSCYGCGALADFIFYGEDFPSKLLYTFSNNYYWMKFVQSTINQTIEGALSVYMSKLSELLEEAGSLDHANWCTHVPELMVAYYEFVYGKEWKQSARPW